MTKVLLALRRSLGDAVLFLGVVERVRHYFPDAEITLLVPRAYASLYLEQKQIAAIWSYEEQGFLSLLAKIRRQKFDYYFDFHSSGKNLWLNRLSGAREAYFDQHSTAAGKLYARYPNALEWNKFFLERILGPVKGVPESELFIPKIELTAAEKMAAASKLKSSGMEPEKIIFLGTGASRRPKRWPAAHFAHLAELLWERHEIGVVLVPGPEVVEQNFVAEVIDCLRVRGLRPQGKSGVAVLTTQSVRELAAVLSQCLMYIGNDSGPKHVAIAAGIPTLTFFGPENPEEWHPYSRTEHPLLFVEGLRCRKEDNGRWCGLQECVIERTRCMVDIDPYAALEKAKPFLEQVL